MKKTLLGITILLSLHLYAQDITGVKPVDEGQQSTPVKDTIKGTKDINNSYEYQEKSLEKIKNGFRIQRKNISHAPFSLLLYHAKNKNFTTLKVEENSINSINFDINKSILKVGDRIIVINNKNSTIKSSPKGKEVLIEIEIIK